MDDIFKYSTSDHHTYLENPADSLNPPVILEELAYEGSAGFRRLTTNLDTSEINEENAERSDEVKKDSLIDLGQTPVF